MNYLVTGGAGFIGSHVVERLLGEGAQVTTIDNYDPFYDRSVKKRNIAALANNRLKFIEADICDRDVIFGLANDYDCIIHLAAKAGVRPSLENPHSYYQTNVLGTINLLEAARAWRVPQFVFASSSSVYGMNPSTPWSEDQSLFPISPYAGSKVSGETLGRIYSHLYGIRFLALRFFTVYGPRQRPDLAIRKFTELMLDERPIQVFGDGSSSRDYTFIGDIVDGIRSATRYTDSLFEIINLANGSGVNLLEMIHGLEMALNTKADIQFVPDQAGDVPQTHANIQKAMQLLGYRPNVGIVEGLALFCRWFLESRRTA